MIGSDKALRIGGHRRIDGTIIINRGRKSARIRIFAFLALVLALSAIGSSVSAIGLAYDVMDASDSGPTVGEAPVGWSLQRRCSSLCKFSPPLSCLPSGAWLSAPALGLLGASSSRGA
jgi:hypothetical protein